MLDAILSTKRAEVAAQQARRPLEVVLDGLQPSDRSFEAALRRDRPALILEIKPRSPSAGLLLPPDRLEPAVAAYRRHASAVSVVTDRSYFGGSPELLTWVRERIPQPVLAKDFILDPYQVFEARRHGADAVLLILAALDDQSYRVCARAAASVGMGVVTEVHRAPEIARAAALGAAVIGINNRDLTTLAVDLDTTPALAALAPPGAILIAESGIRDRADGVRLRSLVDGFLIGTSLLRADRVDRAIRDLVYGPTKICGLTRVRDARAAERAGATHGGLVFAPESPRAVSIDQAERLVEAAPLEWVGVFVDDEADRIAALADRLGLAAVQLHGDESPEVIAALHRRLGGRTEVWKAIRVRNHLPPLDRFGADRILLDGFVPDRRGGAGVPFDWSLCGDLADRSRVILSGGLSPANVAAAEATGIRFLDLSSGVEAAPGLKDPDLLDQLFAARRGANDARTR